MDAEKLMETINAAKVPRGYQMDSDEFAVVLVAAGGDELRLANYASRYGFLKGQRAERAEAKKKALEKRRREMKKEALGYGLLVAIAKKNKSNERFVGCVSRFALRMDGCTDKVVTPDEWAGSAGDIGTTNITGKNNAIGCAEMSGR